MTRTILLVLLFGPLLVIYSMRSGLDGDRARPKVCHTLTYDFYSHPIVSNYAPGEAGTC